MTTLQPSLLLRRALLADGLVGVITTAQLLLLADWLSSLLALPGEFLFGVGVVLIPLVAFLLWLSRRESMARAAVYTVIVQAVVVVVFIELEWLGLKRSQVIPGAFAPASMRTQ